MFSFKSVTKLEDLKVALNLSLTLIKGLVNPGLCDGCHSSGSTNCAMQRKTFFVFSPAEGNFLLYRNFFQPFSYSDEEILYIIAIDPKGILSRRMSATVCPLILEWFTKKIITGLLGSRYIRCEFKQA